MLGLRDLVVEVQGLSGDIRQLSDRLLRVELELQHQKEKQAAEREMFHLRLENLILRYQRDLPPGEKEVSREEGEDNRRSP